jgi:adenine-specific DNA-methyltransferase
MEFNKAYNRRDFLDFLRVNFLPEDFIEQNDNVILRTQTKYTTSAIKLGTCQSLDLVVYEVKHTGKEDPRIGLSKESFRLLADEWQSRALILFVPQDNDTNYRFSLINIDLKEDSKGKPVKEYSSPRRYSYLLGESLGEYIRTPQEYLYKKGRVSNVKELQERFSTEILTKSFYNELSDWYAWAIKIVKFPNDIDDVADDTKYNTESVIRLITRLIFVWFLKQRKLVPDEFFDQEYIEKNLLKDFNPHLQMGLFQEKSNEGKYYKAILQNLFFAMLNSPITPEAKDTITERQFKRDRNGFDNNKLMRYYDKFTNPDLFLKLANDVVPFLNGGLFECLDDKQNKMYIDGFSDKEIVQKHLLMPDYLFFGEEAGRDIDLSEFYGDKKKKKVSARGIIDILKRYNFTVEENTPFDQEVSLDPELLGKVFENLLASFNPETKSTARKQTGSFYTPREIVQYMVDESLVAHLKHTVSEDLEKEYRKLMHYTDEEISLTTEQKKIIMHSLYECKILDPACGSGAFPMGVLQQMVHILSQLDPENKIWKDILMQDAIDQTTEAYKTTLSEERAEVIADIERSFNDNLNRPDYARKLYLIERCIFGVDIQPIAIQISKLRFFISLIVDQKTNNNPVDNFGIRPLPNLEAKFVAANTLIGLNKKDATLFDTIEIKAKENELKEAKHKIFGAKTSRTKNKWKTRVAELRIEIAETLKEANAVGNIEAQQLAQWDMFDQNTYSPFFDTGWMFGITDGFDIVIGNPPYIQLQNNGGELAKQLESSKYKSFSRAGDIYCCFYEKGWQLLRNNGHLCFITSNKWMRTGYGESIRKFFIKETNPIQLIDFAGIKVFESATVDTNILLFAKEKNLGKTICAITQKENKDRLKDLSIFVQQSGNICSFNSSDSWVILSPIEMSIKRKIENVGIPLKDWNIQISYGIKTGYNDAFIISTEKRNEILSNCQTEDERKKTAELIRPILRGRDIKKYGYEWANLWLINTHNGIKGKLPRIKIEDYFAIKAHLDQYWDRIMSRVDKGDTPYNLRNCAYMEDFYKPKIVWGEISDRSKFAFDSYGEFIPEATTFLMVGTNLKYLLCVLNSSFAEWFFSKLGTTTGVGTIRWKKYTIEQLLIPFTSLDNRSYLERVINDYINKGLSKEQMEKMINQKIYSILQLSKEEIHLIENYSSNMSIIE